MLNFFSELLQKKTLPVDDFAPEEKDCYYELITALAKGDFATLNSVFSDEISESSRVLIMRFESFLNNVEKHPLPSNVVAAIENQIPLKAFLSKMHKS